MITYSLYWPLFSVFLSDLDTENSEITYGENKQIISGPGTGLCTQEVDFRYSGGEDCLMLMLDGHIRQEARWGSIWDLESRNGNPGRGIRILELDKRKASPIMTP